MLDNANCTWPNFSNLAPYAKREKTVIIMHFLPLPTAGIEPKPPAEQACALSITQKPLSIILSLLKVTIATNLTSKLCITFIVNVSLF